MHRLSVRQRLAHSHVDDVRDHPVVVLGGPASGRPILAHDLARRELPVEAAPSGCAERASDRATCLGRNAERESALGGDEDRLDERSVGEAPEMLHRAVLTALHRRCFGFVQSERLGERFTLGRGEVRHVGHGAGERLVHPTLDLPHPIARLSTLREVARERRAEHVRREREQVGSRVFGHRLFLGSTHGSGRTTRGIGTRPAVFLPWAVNLAAHCNALYFFNGLPG